MNPFPAARFRRKPSGPRRSVTVYYLWARRPPFLAYRLIASGESRVELVRRSKELKRDGYQTQITAGRAY